MHWQAAFFEEWTHHLCFSVYIIQLSCLCPVQRDSPDDSMKTGAGMVQDKRMDMGSMGDYNGVMGKNLGSRHQLHKESAMDRSPYYDKVSRNINLLLGVLSAEQKKILDKLLVVSPPVWRSWGRHVKRLMHVTCCQHLVVLSLYFCAPQWLI